LSHQSGSLVPRCPLTLTPSLHFYQTHYQSLTTRVAELEVKLVTMVEKDEKAEQIEEYIVTVHSDYEGLTRVSFSDFLLNIKLTSFNSS
jgi:hypothetical protein